MKSIINKSHLILSAIFIMGVVGSAFLLYNLPGAIERISAKIDLLAITEAKPAFSMLNVVVGLTLLFGVISLLTMYFRFSRTQVVEKIVYVDRKEDKQAVEADALAKQVQADFSREYAEIMSAVKGIKDNRLKVEKLLSKICMKIDASQALYYVVKKEKGLRYIEMMSSFAYSLPESETIKYEFGEGLAGQAAKDGKMINISEVPKGYITIISGLGASSPNHLVILPIKQGEEVTAVVEIASFKGITSDEINLISEVLKPEEEVTKVQKKAASADQSPAEAPESNEK
jgi:putative methionine-R-sulfoxide reductase with GAF domain